MKKFISIVENFLPTDEFEKYLNYSKETQKWGNRLPNDNWSGRVIYEPAGTNLDYLKKVEDKIKIDFEITETIYPDYLGLVKWEIGDVQYPHADGELENGIQHEFYWRNFGCVLYLYDDYEGGEIYFPTQNLEIKPKPNTLVFFPGTLDYLHGVKEITNGIRYTLTSFWTYNHKFSMNGYENSTMSIGSNS
jgi:hypothetical protein